LPIARTETQVYAHIFNPVTCPSTPSSSLAGQSAGLASVVRR
jgi:hypothetical protein